MRKDAIERILKQGTVKQKIKLYMTDGALCQVDMDNLILNDQGEIIGSTLLTNKEKESLWESIKEPKDIEYYEKLRSINKVVVFLKEHLTVNVYRLLSLSYKIHTEYSEFTANTGNIEIINDLLELYPDKGSRERAYKLALKKTKGWGGETYQEKGYPKYLDIDIKQYFLDNDVDVANIMAQRVKASIIMFKKILSKQLPLRPYIDWINEEEKKVINIINAIRNITSDIEKYIKANKPEIIKYEDIEVSITDEDIEDFKNVGL